MAEATANPAEGSGTAMRVLLWVLLILFALYFIAPLYVMLVTSLKSVDEIRTGNLLALPLEPSLAAWQKAWSAACVGVECEGSTSISGTASAWSYRPWRCPPSWGR